MDVEVVFVVVTLDGGSNPEPKKYKAKKPFKPELIPFFVARSDEKNIYSPQIEGMLVYCRVTPGT